eukprot:scaffold79575_cov57-Attheya_sp.AAC.1
MHHLDIDAGYLINFPHDSGFPDILDDNTRPNTIFRHNFLLGDFPPLSDRSIRGRNASRAVQIVKVKRERVTEKSSSRQVSTGTGISSRRQPIGHCSVYDGPY